MGTYELIPGHVGYSTLPTETITNEKNRKEQRYRFPMKRQKENA